MNTNYLKYFIALYRTKNMHKAAEELYISQQGLSRIIQSLEKEWGATFFQRSNQGMEPTKAGDYFYEKAVLLQNELINTQRNLQALKEGKKEIRLSLSSGSVHKFYPVIECYRKSNPDLQIRWSEVSERVARRMLLSKEVDAALLTDNEGNDPIVYLPLFRHEQYLLVYQGHPLYECEKIHHAMLKDEILIMETSNRKMISHFDRACRKEGVLPNCIAQSPDTAFCYRLCSQKEGLVVTMDMGYDDLSYPNVRKIPFGEEGYVNQVYFARREHADVDILDMEEALYSMIHT